MFGNAIRLFIAGSKHKESLQPYKYQPDVEEGEDQVIKINKDGLLNALDVAIIVTGKDRKGARQDLRRVSNDNFDSGKFIEQPPIRGGFLTKYVSLYDSIELALALPGKIGWEKRIMFGNAIRLFIAGKESLQPYEYQPKAMRPYIMKQISHNETEMIEFQYKASPKILVEQTADDTAMQCEKTIIEDTPISGLNTFSFVEVIKGPQCLVRVTDDGFVFALDLISVITQTDKKCSAQLLRRLSNEIFDSEKIMHRHIFTKGVYETKLLSFHDAIELIMVLPGKKAQMVKKQFANIIVRYLDGDRSMCNQLKENRTIGTVKSYSRFAGTVVKNMEEEKAKKAYKMPKTSYVYATKSSAFPGLIKIGCTENIPNRLSTLNTSCAPAPHIVVAVAPTFDRLRDEKSAHNFFSSVRKQGEFFQINETDVINYFTTHITTLYNTELTQNIAKLQGTHMNPGSSMKLSV
jgi:hypothetical protein